MEEDNEDDRPVTQKEFKKLESQMATISRDLETFKKEMRTMFAEQRTGQVLTGPIVPAADLTGSEEDQVHNHHWTVVDLRKHKGCSSSVVKVVLVKNRRARLKFE